MLFFKKKILSIILLVLTINCFSQKERQSIWYFGINAGLKFSTTTGLEVLENGALFSRECCASVVDPYGNLLFYTDGRTVYSKDHSIMDNGMDLKGNFSLSQMVVVQKPGTENLFYIFTADTFHNEISAGFNYSVVDINENGGLGRVVIKNINLVSDPCVEKISAVKHANGVDFWIVTHMLYGDGYIISHLSKDGVVETKIQNIGISTTEGIHASNLLYYGHMKFSNDRKKMACAAAAAGVEIMDFDNYNGVFSNPIQIKNFVHDLTNYRYYLWGIEFSPSDEFIYVGSSKSVLFQIDLRSNDPVQMQDEIHVYEFPGIEDIGAIQAAIDGKIYISNVVDIDGGYSYLDVINNPNEKGDAANVVNDAIFLKSGYSLAGLPNFVSSAYDPNFTTKQECFPSPTIFELTEDPTIVSSVEWNLGDGTIVTQNASPFELTHNYSTTGVYDISVLTEFTGGGTSVGVKTITVYPRLDSLSVSKTFIQTDPSNFTYNVNLIDLADVIVGSSGLDYNIYEDIALTKEITGDLSNHTFTFVDPTKKYYLKSIDENCNEIAEIDLIHIQKANETASREYCESNPGTGIVADIDLTTSFIKSPYINPSDVFTWFTDDRFQNPVVGSVDISSADKLYAIVKTQDVHGNTILKNIEYSFVINPLAYMADYTQDIWMNPSIASITINLTDNVANFFTEPYTKLIYDNTMSLIVNPTSFEFGNDTDIIVEADNSLCKYNANYKINRLNYTVEADFNQDYCSTDLYLQNFLLSDFDINFTAADVLSIDYFTDNNCINLIDKNTAFVLNSSSVYYARIIKASSRSIIPINISINPPVVIQSITREFFAPATDPVVQIDLKTYENDISTAAIDKLWYSDNIFTSSIDPESLFGFVNDEKLYIKLDYVCDQSAVFDIKYFQILEAENLSVDFCESSIGSNSRMVDLSAYHTQINSALGLSFDWYETRIGLDESLHSNPIADPLNYLIIGDNTIYCIVDDGKQKAFASFEFKVNAIPTSALAIIELKETDIDSKITKSVILSSFNNQINQDATIQWYDDLAHTVLVDQNLAVDIANTKDYFLVIDLNSCQNSESVRFNIIDRYIKANKTKSLCVDDNSPGVSNLYNLVNLNQDFSANEQNFRYYYDNKLNNQITGNYIIDLDIYKQIYLCYEIGSQEYFNEYDFVLNNNPSFLDLNPIYCEAVFDSSVSKLINLNDFNNQISSDPAVVYQWYEDIDLNDIIVNTSSYELKHNSSVYCKVSNANCSVYSTITPRINPIPKSVKLDKIVCFDTLRNQHVVNLYQFKTDLTEETNSIIWLKSENVSDVLQTPEKTIVEDNSEYFANIINSHLCSNVSKLMLDLEENPLLKSLTDSICEDVLISNNNIIDLSVYEEDMKGLKSKVELKWYEDSIYEIDNKENYLMETSSTLSLVANYNNCYDTSKLVIKLLESPKFDLGDDVVLKDEFVHVLSIPNRNPDYKYEWSTGESSDFIRINETDYYSLKVTDQRGCVAIDSVYVQFDNYGIMIPTAFSPNNDGINDYFLPSIKENAPKDKIEIRIFNRTGGIQFIFNEKSGPWDGKVRGVVAHPGLYIWILRIDGKDVDKGYLSIFL
ncbi:MAG: gliding motility-associated C-terminal domain-containing protein [Marinifilaceae bacterium]|jgi:gliding motility-associated-like protein|nr:gliding motility-associated C-terminal domain-containing protein [Marinifilaceae bacterium]